ncbi:uncharacterized protein LOC111382012 [Olea europaea var. sylvestris]|uniref:uncharacterized protein LOC111382012 n=1 Tax=Olea europaea var. sylvestris TaxID=158386 RepID=UPI000C1CEF20|nr:uncharacterized protein LOC111382012 [Olea europaea var. sylvestris]
MPPLGIAVPGSIIFNTQSFEIATRVLSICPIPVKNVFFKKWCVYIGVYFVDWSICEDDETLNQLMERFWLFCCSRKPKVSFFQLLMLPTIFRVDEISFTMAVSFNMSLLVERTNLYWFCYSSAINLNMGDSRTQIYVDLPGNFVLSAALIIKVPPAHGTYRKEALKREKEIVGMFLCLFTQIVVFDKSTLEDDSIDVVENNSDEYETGAAFLIRILRYLEKPQYLRKGLFPKHRFKICGAYLVFLCGIDITLALITLYLGVHSFDSFAISTECITLKNQDQGSVGTLLDVGLGMFRFRQNKIFHVSDLQGKNVCESFDLYLSTCPCQGNRTFGQR